MAVLLVAALLVAACGGQAPSGLPSPTLADSATQDVIADGRGDTALADTLRDSGGDQQDSAPDAPDTMTAPDAPQALDATSDSAADAVEDAADDVPEDSGASCPNACCHDDDCDDSDACTTDRCDDGACRHVFDPCDDDDECTMDSCDVTTGCVHEPIAGCCPVVWSWSVDFEDATEAAFTVEDLARNTNPEDPADLPIVWNVSTARAHSGAQSLYSGDPATGTYDDGRWVSSRAVSPPLELSPDEPSILAFWVYLDVEAGDGIDTLNVGVLANGVETPVWSKTPRIPLRDWTRVTVDLAAFQGLSVQLVLHFDTLDGRYNHFEGVYVDDLAVGEACAPRTCQTDDDCDDDLDCTEESCSQGGCVYDTRGACCLNPADCRDGDSCTVDTCSNGSCAWAPDPTSTCCDSAEACDDGDPCTTDRCWDHRCDHRPSGEPGCCTADDQCVTGDPCDLARCDADGACVIEDVCCHDDADCDDGDDCTSERCLLSGDCHSEPTGVPGCCSPTILAMDFDDGSLANLLLSNSDEAVGWTVHGGAGTQSRSLALYYGDPERDDYDSSGTLNHGEAKTLPIALPRAVGLALDFQVYLDVEAGPNHDRLTASLWVRGVELSIWKKDAQTPLQTWLPVHVDLSGFGGESVELSWSFDTVDGEGNEREGVYVDDVAISSTCMPRRCSLDPDCDDAFGATSERCDSLGSCQVTLADTLCELDGQCDDGDVCTNDACDGGGCVSTPTPGCCHDDEACDDGDVCTEDRCSGGDRPRCASVPIPECCVGDESCDDGDPCTIDTCPGLGLLCLHERQPGCCVSSLDCDDDDPCTLERCEGGACVYVASCCVTDADCDDGDDTCTIDECDAEGRCVFTPTGVEGCCGSEIYQTRWAGLDAGSFRFDNESALYGWSLVADGPPSELVGVAAPYLYYGDPSDLQRYGDPNDGANGGSAWSSWIDLPADTQSTLSFALWMNAESGFDKLELWIDFNGRQILAFTADRPAPRWETHELDLSFAAGHALRFGFRFEADAAVFDGDEGEAWQGAFIDDVRVVSTCVPAPCSAASDCATVACVTSSCENGACSYVVPTACCDRDEDCDDHNPCTDERCEGHVCASSPSGAIGCCVDAADCEDGDACTVETCEANQCAVSFSAGCRATLPYCQSFDASASLDALGFETWTLAGSGANALWSIREDGVTGMSARHLSFDGGSVIVNDFERCAVTPTLDAEAAGDHLTLTFDHRLLDNDEIIGDCVLQVRVSDDDGESWRVVRTYAEADGPFPTTHAIVGLPEESTGAEALRVAFCVEGPSSDGVVSWDIDRVCCVPGAAPVIAPIADRQMEVGVVLEVPIATSDADGDPVSLTLMSGPPFLHLTDHGDGTATLLASPSIDDEGIYETVIAATDGQFSVTESFSLRVAVPGQATIFSQDFADGGTLGQMGWSERVDGAPGEANWQLVDTSEAFEGRAARFEDEPTVSNFDHALVSPVFDASTVAQVNIAWRDAFSYACCESLVLSLLASDDAGESWSELWLYQGHVDDDYPVTEHSVDATAVLAGAAQARLAFRVTGVDSYDVNYWEIASVEVSGLDAGEPPAWELVEDLVAPVGSVSRFALAASDPDTPDLSFLPGGDTPAFVSVDNDGAQTATLVVSPGIGDAGDYDFQLKVTDGFHPIAQPIHLSVLVTGAAPTADPVPPLSVVAGEELRTPLHAEDPDGQTLSWRLGPDAPAFVRLWDHGTGDADLLLRPTVSDLGDASFTVAVDDGTQRVVLPVLVHVVYAGGAPLLGEDFDGTQTLTERGWRVESDADSPDNDWRLISESGWGDVRFEAFPMALDYSDRLVSPIFDTSGHAAVTLRFRTTFRDYAPMTSEPPATMRALGSVDGGASWVELWRRVETDGDLVDATLTVDAHAIAGAENARIAFEITGGDSRSIERWEVDDVTIAGE